MRRAGQVQSKADILAGVWPHDFDGDPNIVEVYVGRLRRLVDEPFGRRSLETVRGAGYRDRRRRGGRMRFRSVRFRITALATLIAAVVLTACAVLVVAMVEQQLEDNLDHSLAQRADQVEAATLIDPGTALANTNQEDRFVQVLDADGGVLFASDNLAGRPAVVEPPSGDQTASTHSDIPIEDDLYRVLVRRYSVDGVDRFVVVGENVDDVRDAVNALIAVLAVTIPTAVAVLAFAVWWLVGRTLRPVEQIRREVASIGLDQLGRRVPEPGTGDEIDRLAATMNEMLARLEESAARQRQFVGDASHELRSPLTRMRTTLEVDLATTPTTYRRRATAHSTT